MVILLKSLEDHLFKASISEDMLEILEVLEKHLLDGSNSITTTMKSAYCRVAVECTLKYLEAKASHPIYLQAVDRIWRGRILAIASHGSHLFSDDLKNWKTEIENSLLDINKFVSLPDTRMEALHKVQMFFDQAWDYFCASFQIVNEDMNQEAQSEYHNANAYVANSQDDCQNINNNEAACSHEGATTSNTVGVTLRRSKRKNSSPLKHHEPTEITKRRRNIWSESEVDTLRSGVLKFGREWKKILNFYGFEKRTAVDLKEKWTNILKSEAKQNKGKRNICK